MHEQHAERHAARQEGEQHERRCRRPRAERWRRRRRTGARRRRARRRRRRPAGRWCAASAERSARTAARSPSRACPLIRVKYGVAIETAMIECGSMKISQAMRSTATEASSAPAVKATLLCTMPASWVTRIIPNVQPAARTVPPSPTPRQRKSGRKPRPVRRQNSSSTSACAAMPSVAPPASSAICGGVQVAGSWWAGSTPNERGEDQQRDDRDDVVEHRRPGERPEDAARVEHLAEQASRSRRRRSAAGTSRRRRWRAPGRRPSAVAARRRGVYRSTSNGAQRVAIDGGDEEDARRRG